MPDLVSFIFRFALFAALHSLFATKLIKRVFSRAGKKEPRCYRLVYNLISIIMFGWVIAAYRNSPVLYYAHGAWSLVMYLFQLIIAIILFGCLRQTGTSDFLGLSSLSTADPAPTPLITTGWYAIVRHPLYLLSSIFLILNPVMTTRWLLLSILSICYFIIGALLEEKRLQNDYGDAYRQYRQQVPFIMPSFKRLKQSPSA